MNDLDLPLSPEEEQRIKDVEVMMDRHASELAEHFDAVQIFTSRLLPDGTTEGYSRGSGNWMARYGQVEQWVKKQ